MAAVAADRTGNDAFGIDRDHRAGCADAGIGARLRIGDGDVGTRLALFATMRLIVDILIVAMISLIALEGERKARRSARRGDVGGQGIGVKNCDRGRRVLRAAWNAAGAVFRRSR